MATLTHDLKNPLIGANRILELMAGGSLVWARYLKNNAIST
jgi:hypothetical protein